VNCRSDRMKPRHDLSLEPLREHVFVHQDLAPRNMIVDAQNQLWIVDWGYAGFYPSYMEYLGIVASGIPWIFASTWRARFARWRWSFLRWIVMGRPGPYAKPFHALAEVHRRSCIYRLEKTPYSQVSSRQVCLLPILMMIIDKLQ